MTALAIDYVSPLPPVRSGIADYSVDLLPHLAARADVRVLALPGQPVAPEVVERFGPVPLEEVAASGGTGGRLPLYQMGNNRHHEAVAAAAMARPGVLTLHDMVLHHLVSELTLGVRDFAAYERRLERDHGWIGRAAARPRRWGATVEAALFELPAHRTLVRSQRAVLVHNRWAAARLLEAEPGLAVRVVPMGVPLPPPADREAGRALRRRLGLPEDAPVIGSFGFQTPIKRTDRVIAALARPGLERVHLLVVGESPEQASLAEEAARHGVGDRVIETGFLPFDEMTAAIAASDLCSNLRYPTAGETSASLLRVLAVGRPVIVSDHAQFAELPEAVAVRVPLDPDDEVESLAASIRALLAAPEQLRAMGEAARRHVATEHAPERAAEAILDACDEHARTAPLDPPGTESRAVVPPPTSLTRTRLAGSVTFSGHEGWRPGERRRVVVTLANSGDARWLPAEAGPGGVALEVVVADSAGRQLDARPWIPLPRDLAPGEEHRFELALRRPPGAGRLAVAAQVVGSGGRGALGAGSPLAGVPLGGPGAELVWQEPA